ncbi:MAG: hypothetical protein HKM06_07835 [Spirochaetales bacterium]|nr:hypothetical protein [Spirochaetales bacterium]
MKKKALVLSVDNGTLTVAVSGNGDSTEPIAACCVVPSQKLEIKNTLAADLVPGDEVWISDGLGAMVGAGLAFIAFPGILYLVCLLLFPHAVAYGGIALGLGLAYLKLRSLHLSQYPQLVSRLSTSNENPADGTYQDINTSNGL